jgi:glucokinase
MAYAIGVDLGASETKVLAVAEDGAVLAERTAATDDGPHRRWATAVGDLIAGVERERGSPARWLGLCGPGLAAADGRSIAWMAERMEATVGFDWSDFLGRPVPVLNDGHAALLGEAWRGAARGIDDVAMLTLGTGVGGAIMVGGELLRGAIGRAGHVGHMTVDARGLPSVCRMPGGLDDRIGNATLARRSKGRFRDTRALVAAARRGDEAAAELWRGTIRDLACAIASLVNLVDPALVVVGGGIAEAGADLFEPLAAEMDRVEWRPNGHRVPIRAALLGTHAGALGAARNAMDAACPR